MAGGIFISYRRDDTRHVAGRLSGDLADRFGAASIFRDVESIDGGEEFPEKLEKALSQCQMMLVLIGAKWLNIADANGRRRLDNPEDWVRQEIATALRRKVRVVPVMVEDTPLPAEHELPEDLRPLINRQIRKLSDERWRGDLQDIVDMLAKVPGLELQPKSGLHGATGAASAAVAPAGSSWKKVGVGVAAGALAVVAIAVAFSGPDVKGHWRTDTAETYTITADGSSLAIEIKEHDEFVGSGTGHLDGDKLTLSLSVRKEGQEYETHNCALQWNSGESQFAGQCTDPQGEAYDWLMKR